MIGTFDVIVIAVVTGTFLADIPYGFLVQGLGGVLGNGSLLAGIL